LGGARHFSQGVILNVSGIFTWQTRQERLPGEVVVRLAVFTGVGRKGRSDKRRSG
jgi:hypothetical protein